MAAADASTFPVYQQAFRIHGVILDGTTGNAITGGLTGLAAHRMIDGDTAFATTGLTVAEIGTTGYFTVDLTSTPMTSRAIVLEVRATNSNAVYWKRVLVPVDLSESGTRAPSQTVKRFEQYWVQMEARWFNRNTINRDTGVYTVYDIADSTALYATAANGCADDGTTGTMGKLS